MKTITWLGALGLFLVVLAPASRAADLKTVKMVIPRGSAFVLSYNGARDAGIFRKHGIEVIGKELRSKMVGVELKEPPKPPR